jgi:hypothetical protein
VPLDTSIQDLVNQLTRVGLRPPERLVKQILSYGEDGRAPLLALATDFELLDEPDNAQRLGPLHALRLLGEMAGPENIAPLLDALPVPSYGEEDVASEQWAREVLQILGRGGSAIIPDLWDYADDTDKQEISRAAAMGVLPFAVEMSDAGRDEVLAEARRRLADEPVPVIGSALVRILAYLGDSVSYRLVMDAYRAGHVDQTLMPAAHARQLLLGNGASEVACVHHPLWERYDEHGPAERDMEGFE